MKKPIVIVLLTLGISALALIAAHLVMLDGLDGWIFRRWFSETTEFAPRYSDSGFRRITMGMTTQEVIGVIGSPLDTFCVRNRTDNFTVTAWRYSRSTNDSHFTMRLIQFRDGEVIRKVAEYYVD